MRVALAASLLLNLVLGACIVHLMMSEPKGASAISVETQLAPAVGESTKLAGEVPPPAPAAAVSQNVALAWTMNGAGATLEELRRLGAPRRVLLWIATAIVDQESPLNRRASGNPRWKHPSFSLTPEERRAQMEDAREHRESNLRRLLGADYDLALAEAAMISGKFGELSTEKVADVIRIERDYAKIRDAQAKTPQARNLLEREKFRDLSAILSPDELADYLAIHSELATQLQQRLRHTNLNDEQYRQVYDAARQFRETFYAQPGNANMPDESVPYRLAELEALRGALSDDVIVSLAQQDRDFAKVLTVYQKAKEPSAAMIGRYQAYLAFFSEMETIQGTSRSQAQTYETGRPAADRAYAELTRGLSPLDQAMFDRTEFGRFLARFRNPDKK